MNHKKEREKNKMKEKQYKELNKSEKVIVGYIYDLYVEWAFQRLETNHLKNSLFYDFCDEMKLDESSLKDYIDYSYLLEYKKENEVKDVKRGYGYIVPKTELFKKIKFLEELKITKK